MMALYVHHTFIIRSSYVHYTLSYVHHTLSYVHYTLSYVHYTFIIRSLYVIIRSSYVIIGSLYVHHTLSYVPTYHAFIGEGLSVHVVSAFWSIGGIAAGHCLWNYLSFMTMPVTFVGFMIVLCSVETCRH